METIKLKEHGGAPPPVILALVPHAHAVQRDDATYLRHPWKGRQLGQERRHPEKVRRGDNSKGDKGDLSTRVEKKEGGEH